MIDENYSKGINSVNIFLLLSFAFFLPISQKISTINIVLLVVVSLLNIRKGKTDFKKGFIAPIGLYTVYCLSLIYSSELQLGIIEQKASLLFFPIIFILNKDVIKYRDLSSSLGIDTRVHLVGQRPVGQIGHYMAQADVLVSPRIQGLNTPMKVYSYLDSGVAVLATRLSTPRSPAVWQSRAV